jgi:hypothetical protein
MNLLQEQRSRIIHNDDITQFDAVVQSAVETPAPDARAAELREQLLSILTKEVVAVQSQQQPEQRLTDEFNAWQEQYNEWIKGAH